MRHIPNIITTLRIVLIPVLVMEILAGNYKNALLLVAVMGASDAIDGFLAKQYGWISSLGEKIDPLADKLMLISVFVALVAIDLLPLWFMVLAVVRDVGLLAWSVFRRVVDGQLSVRPTKAGKVNTFVQVLLVISILAGQLAAELAPLTQTLLFVAVATTVASGAQYVYFICRHRSQLPIGRT